MLHDPSHITQKPAKQDIILNNNDKNILKQLGEKIACFADIDKKSGKALLWQNLNDLQSKRPMVWINEIPWHEMNVNDELTLKCTHPFAKDLERELRRTIYQRTHMGCDMIISDYIECPKVFHSTDFGILEQVTTAHTDDDNEIYSRHFEIQIKDEKDIDKIKIPQITYLEKATQYNFDVMKDVFEGIIDVIITGQKHIWYTPWDYLIRWWGIEQAMLDLFLRPEMVHAAYERMVEAWSVELDQFEENNLLSLDNNNTRIGSGGYGYTSSLPGDEYNKHHVYAENMWGCSNAQIFSSVSPQMHYEFAIEHDLKWLKRFGLTYYGCCEPLDNKIDILKKIPNLRKISVSPWCNTKTVTEKIGEDYVMSRKPNPAIFVGGNFDIVQAKKELTDFMEYAKDGHVEIIMKDISTVNYNPENLWKWSEIAANVAEEYSK